MPWAERTTVIKWDWENNIPTGIQGFTGIEGNTGSIDSNVAGYSLSVDATSGKLGPNGGNPQCSSSKTERGKINTRFSLCGKCLHKENIFCPYTTKGQFKSLSYCCPFVVRLLSDYETNNKRTTNGQQSDKNRTRIGQGREKEGRRKGSEEELKKDAPTVSCAGGDVRRGENLRMVVSYHQCMSWRR